MRFRIKEHRGATYGMIKRFQVEYTDAWWPFGGWRYYTLPAYPHEYAEFDSLEEARLWIKGEKNRLREKELAEKEERERTKPVYHNP